MSLVRTLGVIIVAGLVSAPGALAAVGAPIAVAPNATNPEIAVDAHGTAHLAWSSEGAAADTGVTSYCQIPAGGTACVDAQHFPTPWYGPSSVLLGPNQGQVVLLQQGNTDINAWESTDGGQTFAAGPNGPTGTIVGRFTTADVQQDEQPAFGPGAFSASWMDYAGDFENVPINSGPPVGTLLPTSPAPPTAALFSGCGAAASSTNSIALLDATTPVAECENMNTGVISYRVATGQGSLNDIASGSWGPVQQLPGDSSGALAGARLAGGPRGVFLLYDAPGSTMDVRQLVNGTFGPPRVIAANTYAEGFSQDATGNLFVVSQDAAFPSAGKQQRVFTSPDATTWTEVALNLAGVPRIRDAEAEIAGCAAADGTSSTGSGFVVFDPVNVNSEAYAESFGNAPCGAGQGSSTCPTRLTVGAAQLVATVGCFAAGAKGTYTTRDRVELNGLTIDPSGSLVVDTVNHTLTAAAPATVHASKIELDRHALDWLLPTAPGSILDLADDGEPVAFDPSALHSTMLGFAIDGTVTPSLKSDGRASLPVNVALPQPIGGIIGPAPTDDVDLATGNLIPGGLDLDPGSIDLRIPDVSLGIAQIDPFDVRYDSDPDVFDGTVGLKFPVIGSSVLTHFRFQQGRFVEGDASGDFGMNLPVFTDVFLQKINLRVAGERGNVCADPSTDSDGPTSISGGISLALGPIVGGTALADVDGNASYTFPEPRCNEPGVFEISGDGAILGVSVANADLTFKTNGVITFGASIGIGDHALGVFVDAQGGVAVQNPASFYLTGNAQVYIGGLAFGPTITVSSIGIGACLNPVGFIEYHWGGNVSGQLFSTSCDMSDLIPQAFASKARAADAPMTVDVPRNDPVEGIRLTSASGAPLVRISGPGGATVTTAPAPAGAPAAMTTGSAADVIVSPSQNTTFVKLIAPAAGRWTITPLPGSPAITAVATARGLAPIAVHAHVTAGRGRDRSLVYSDTPAAGRAITFVEHGAGGLTHVVATTHSAHGTIRFAPAAGPAGRRTIAAQVTERGMTDGRPITVATYVAPGPPALVRPPHLRVTRHATTLAIAWGRVPGAARYAIRAILRDGRAPLVLAPATKRSLRVAAVPAFDAGRVMVAALNANGQPGPIATATLRALPATCRHPTAKRGRLVCAKPKRARPRAAG